MWKWVGIFAVIAIAIIAMARDQHYAREKYQTQSQADCIELSISPEEKHACAKETQSRKDYAPWWFILVAWPEGITTWAIIATGLVVAWQSNETRKAANASRDSLKIQEAEFIQWIDIGEWKIEYDRSKHQLGRSGHQATHHPPGPMEVRLSFPLLNNTTRPMYINSVETVLTIGPEKNVKTFVTRDHVSAPPKGEYRVVIDTTISEDQITQFVAFALFMEVAVKVQFFNALRKPDEAYFLRLAYFNAFDGNETVSKGHVAREIQV